jgi:predicted metal-dependent phosphoesterase TrpH
MPGIDLHAHTTASDGSLTPTELVSLAAEIGLQALAVTDHDTVDGLVEATNAAKDAGIEFVPGIELAVTYPTGRFHMLGYFIQHDNPTLCDRLHLLKDNRANRNARIVEKLNALGIDVTLDDIVRESGGGQVGRPHMAAALVKKGVVTTFQEAFDKYIADGAAAHVPKDKISLEQGLKLIHTAGGLAVMAHPSSLKLSDSALAARLPRLRDLGLDGIECYYSQHEPARTAWLLEQAQRAGLLATGGSDFHGTPKPHVQLGVFHEGGSAPYSVLESMKSRLSAQP